MGARESIQKLETIMTNSSGADLKIDDPDMRVWLEPDGETISIEVLDSERGRWDLLTEIQ